MVHMKILEKCGGELEHSLRSRCIEPFSTEEYINELEDIVTRKKIGRTWKKFDIKSPKKPFLKKDKQEKLSSPIHPTVMSKESAANVEDHNDKAEESDSEKDTEESETPENDEINTINAQINNSDFIYEVLDVNSSVPQLGTSDKSLTKIQDAKLYRTKPEKGMGYTAGKSSTILVMAESQDAKINLDTGAYCTCVGKNYLKTFVPDWEGKHIPIQILKLSSASESMKPLGMIDLTLIFPHPSQCIRLKVEFVVMDNCTSNHFILGNDYFSIYGIDISSQKDRYFTIRDNKRQKFGFFNNKRKITAIKDEEQSLEKYFFIAEQPKEAAFNH
ncbi:hypothetical protein O181_097643 [Austropuccinia psidii MF-1]|uniref:Uncharacterized protein n=1 Tax=Austropuccinia psidii MF-1 TaxID=1389203 RepID=A0A9Q3PDD4_9BASI|nr:hypothetical protein [Austropuccinia psidii MF-1]